MEIPDIYSALPPRLQALKDNRAKALQNRSNIERYFSGANVYETTAEASKREDSQRAAYAIDKLSPTLGRFDDAEMDAFRSALEQELASRPEVPGEAKLSNPNLMQAIVAAVGAAVNPRHSADILSTPFNEQLRRQQADTRQMQQQYASDMDAYSQRVGLAQQGYRDAREDRDAEGTRRLQIEQFNIVRQEQAQERKDRMERLAMDDMREDKEKAWSFYEKNPTDANAEKLRALDPEFAPTPEQVRRDQTAANAKNANSARLAWTQQTGMFLNQFGEVSEEDEQTLEQTRQSIALQFGIDPSVLVPVKSGKTLKREQFEQKQEEFRLNLDFKGQQHADNLAAKRANIDIARQRLEVYRESVDAAVKRGEGSLAIQQYRAQLQAQKARTDTYEADLGKTEKDLNQKIVEWRMRADTSTGAPREKASMQLQQYRDQLAWLQVEKAGLQDIGKWVEDELGVPRSWMGQPEPAQTPGQPPVTAVPGLSGPIGGFGNITVKPASKKPAKKPAKKTVKKTTPPPGWRIDP